MSNSRVAGSIFCRSLLTTPWSVALDAGEAGGVFHFVLGGACWLELPDENRRLQLVRGDVVLLPHGAAHVVSDAPGRRPVRFDDLLAGCEPGLALELRFGGDGPETTLLSGGYAFDAAASHPILSYLPSAIYVAGGLGESDATVQPALRWLAAEIAQRRTGYQAIVDRLVDVLYVCIVRSWLEGQPEAVRGWIAALRHPQIGEALCLLHSRPEQRWTVQSLARSAGMSRSAFALTFKELTGESPTAYLTAQRMELAANLLRRSSLSLADIAARTGYASEYSFGKAFKRARDVSPGRFRGRA